MKVAMYYKNSDVRIEEMQRPSIGSKELLVKVVASGICGTDVLEWYRIKKAPLVLGHEMSGVVEEVGEEVKNFSIGDRVFVTHHVPCNVCKYCNEGHHTACDTLHTTNFYPGGFSEYLKVPEINVRHGTFKLPDNISYEEATFIEPLGTVIRGQRIANVHAGQKILIIGSGIAGLLHVKLAKAAGVSNITATDVSDFRLEMARKFGANRTVNVTQQEILGDAKGVGTLDDKFDTVILCTGALPAAKQATQCVDKGGTLLFFAVPTEDLPMQMNNFWRNEIKFVTSYAAAPLDLMKSIELIKSKVINVKDMITHQLPLTEAQKGFNLVASGQGSIKVILKP